MKFPTIFSISCGMPVTRNRNFFLKASPNQIHGLKIASKSDCTSALAVLQSAMMVLKEFKLGVKLHFWPAGVQGQSLIPHRQGLP